MATKEVTIGDVARVIYEAVQENDLSIQTGLRSPIPWEEAPEHVKAAYVNATLAAARLIGRVSKEVTGGEDGTQDG